MLRTLELSDVTWEDEGRIWNVYLAEVSQAMQSTCDATLKHTPGELYFNRNYFIFACLWTHAHGEHCVISREWGALENTQA